MVVEIDLRVSILFLPFINQYLSGVGHMAVLESARQGSKAEHKTLPLSTILISTFYS